MGEGFGRELSRTVGVGVNNRMEHSPTKLEGILHQESSEELILITFVVHHWTVLRIANESGVLK